MYMETLLFVLYLQRPAFLIGREGPQNIREVFPLTDPSPSALIHVSIVPWHFAETHQTNRPAFVRRLVNRQFRFHTIYHQVSFSYQAGHWLWRTARVPGLWNAPRGFQRSWHAHELNSNFLPHEVDRDCRLPARDALDHRDKSILSSQELVAHLSVSWKGATIGLHRKERT